MEIKQRNDSCRETANKKTKRKEKSYSFRDPSFKTTVTYTQ